MCVCVCVREYQIETFYLLSSMSFLESRSRRDSVSHRNLFPNVVNCCEAEIFEK